MKLPIAAVAADGPGLAARHVIGPGMLDELFRALVIVPFLVVPVALISWTIFQVTVRGAAIKAVIGLVAGAGLCFAAFLLFFINIYCENCAGRPVSAREAVAVIAYLIFGIAMLLALWWTARPRSDGRSKQPPKERHHDEN